MRKKAIECIEIIDGNKEEKVLSEERNLNQLKNLTREEILEKLEIINFYSDIKEIIEDKNNYIPEDKIEVLDNDNYSDNQKLIGRIIKEAEYI